MHTLLTPTPLARDADLRLFYRNRDDCRRAYERRTPVDLLLYGDSLTALWRARVWRSAYRRLPNALALGVGGNHTGHMLWRLRHAEAALIEPRVVVLCAGANMVWPRFSDAEIVDGVLAVRRALGEWFPDAKLYVNGVLPQSAVVAEKIRDVNAQLAFVVGPERYIDPSPFVGSGGAMRPEYTTDGVHLSSRGYHRWADLLVPLASAPPRRLTVQDVSDAAYWLRHAGQERLRRVLA